MACESEGAIAEERKVLRSRIADLEKELNALERGPRARGNRLRKREIQGNLLQLQTKFNSFAPISRLPVELFTMILMICRSFSSETEEYPYLRERDYGHETVIHITHTCRAWRNLALSYPSVWTVIHSDNPAYIKACIKRSGKLPLSVDYDSHPHTSREFWNPTVIERALRVVSKGLPRICRLKISCLSDWCFDVFDLEEQTKLSLPLLESLELNLPNDTPYWISSYSLTRWFLSHTLPSLKRLYVADLGFEWWKPQGIPVHLTDLTIKMHDYEQGSAHDRCSMAEVLASLRQLPALQHLDLEQALPDYPQGDDWPELKVPEESQRVLLPHLKALRLVSILLGSVHLLNHLKIPSTAVVSLMGEVEEAWMEPTIISPYLMPVLTGKSTIEMHAPILAFGIEPCREGPTEVSFNAHRTLLPLETLREFTTLQNFDLTVWPVSKVLPSIMQFCYGFHDALRTVQTLWLGSVHPLTVEDFLTMFRHLKDLRTLELNEFNVKILPELLMSPDTNSTSDKGNLVFPHLTTVEISWFTFKGQDHGGIAEDAFWKELIDALKRRKERGFGIRKLIFRDCTNIGEGDGKFVQSLFPSIVEDARIEWSGKVDSVAHLLGDWEESDCYTSDSDEFMSLSDEDLDDSDVEDDSEDDILEAQNPDP
ncbi:unnamed protein product [Somion occarium]|uniref:F-box domain-containing protein n=1 Tax=Somion occarium TaxID=3059160 RepID=A0ABP1D0S4_9APHY